MTHSKKDFEDHINVLSSALEAEQHCTTAALVLTKYLRNLPIATHWGRRNLPFEREQYTEADGK